MTTNGNSITSCVSLVILGTGKLLSHVASKSMTTKYSYSSISRLRYRDRDVSYHLRVESWITQITNNKKKKKEGNGWNNGKKIECAVRRCWLTMGGFSSTPTTLPSPLREFTAMEDFMFRVVVVVVVVILLTGDNEMERWRWRREGCVGGSSDKGCYPSLWFLRFEVRPNSSGTLVVPTSTSF